MGADPKLQIPVLTEEVGAEPGPPEQDDLGDRESLIAELQTELAANTFELTDEIMRKAFAEMEASVFEQISSRLRRDLPELIDMLLRERLGQDPDD